MTTDAAAASLGFDPWVSRSVVSVPGGYFSVSRNPSKGNVGS